MGNYIEVQRESGMMCSSLERMIDPDGKNFYQIVAEDMGLKIYPEGQEAGNEPNDWQVRIQKVGKTQDEKQEMVLVTIRDRYYEFAKKIKMLERGESLEDGRGKEPTRSVITTGIIKIEEKEPLPLACLEKT